MKHTPGRWVVSSYQKVQSKRCVFEGPHGMLGWVGTDRDQGLYEEAEANAHLIAAAPELYEACKMALLKCQITDSWHNDVLKQAIAKAEGKEAGQ